MSRDTTLHELGFSEVNSDSQKERPRSYAGCMSHGARVTEFKILITAQEPLIKSPN